MKKTFIVVLVLLMFMGCTPADRLSYAKDRESQTTGIPRTFSVISAYTGDTVWTRHVENSYFTGSNSDIDILDLKSGDKISILMTTGFMLITEEKSNREDR